MNPSDALDAVSGLSGRSCCGETVRLYLNQISIIPPRIDNYGIKISNRMKKISSISGASNMVLFFKKCFYRKKFCKISIFFHLRYKLCKSYLGTLRLSVYTFSNFSFLFIKKAVKSFRRLLTPQPLSLTLRKKFRF